jgi:large conductance mechanosensitive channel
MVDGHPENGSGRREGGPAVLQEFKDFINRGNVMDLAVAVVIGGAFALVVTSFTDDVLMQIVAAIIGEPDFSSLTFDLGDSVIRYGAFITALINFVIIAFAVFLVVKAVNAAQGEQAEEEAGPSETDLLAEIRDELKSQRS